MQEIHGATGSVLVWGAEAIKELFEAIDLEKDAEIEGRIKGFYRSEACQNY